MNEESGAPNQAETAKSDEGTGLPRPTFGRLMLDAWSIYKNRPLHYSAGVVGAFALIVSVQAGISILIGVEQLYVRHDWLSEIWLGLLTLVTDNWFLFGLYALLLSEIRAPYASGLAQLIYAGGKHVRGAAALIIYTLLGIGGIILGFIPGVVASVRYMFAPYLVFEDTGSLTQAFQRSATMTAGHFWYLLLVSVGMLVVGVSGIALFGVGVAFTAPLAFLMHVQLYRTLKKNLTDTNHQLFFVRQAKSILIILGVVGLVTYIVSILVGPIAVDTPPSVPLEERDLLEEMSIA